MEESLGSLYLGGTDLAEPGDHTNGTFVEAIEINPSEGNENSVLNPQIEKEHASTLSHKRDRSTDSLPVRRTKKCTRTPGGTSAIPKPVQVDYDSDDARIIELKQQGHTDKYVARRLEEEGRVRYVPKTVSTRWLRLRKVLEQVEDEKLDDEMSDWHVHEDENLSRSFAAMEDKFANELERLQARKWREVAIDLAARLQKKKFSSKACRERFEGLQSGTASLPVEHDPDPDGRRALQERRIAEAKSHRAAEAKTVGRVKLEERRSRAERIMAKVKKVQQRKTEQEKRSARKMEEKRIREEREVGRKQVVANRKAVMAAVQQRQADKRHEKNVIETLHVYMTGKSIHPRGDRRRSRSREWNDQESFTVQNSVEGDCEELTSVELGNSEAGTGESDGDDHAHSNDRDSERMSSSGNEGVGGQRGAKSFWTNAQVEVPVTKTTLLNPRSVLTDVELQLLLYQRDLPRRNPRETHAQVVARLAAADEELTNEELDYLLDGCIGFEKRVSMTSKEQKVRSLQHIDAMQSFAGSGGIVATSKEFKKGYEGYRGEFRYLLADNETGFQEFQECWP